MVHLTVAAALQLEVFTRGEVTVFAGEGFLDREVRWIHAGEIPDIARFLSGGEMLLTAGLGIGDTEAKQRWYVRSVAEAGAAALVVELAGRMFSQFPPAVIDEAEQVGLPLAGLKNEIPFVEASAQVHSRLVDLRVRELIDDEAANQAFTQILLGGDDYLALTDELARRLGCPVVLEDGAHQVRAYSGPWAESDGIIADWDAHSRLADEPAGETATPRGPDPAPTALVPRCTRRPVVLRGELWGYLHALHREQMLPVSGLHALDRAATAIAITLLGERESGARRAQRHGALINRLMLGDISGEDFVRRALTLGRDMRNATFVVVMAGDDGGGDTAGERELAHALTEARVTPVVADIGGKALAVAALRAGGGVQAVTAALERHGVRAGMSRVVPAHQLPLAVEQARTAHAAANIGAVKIRRFDDLGVLRLLVLLAQGPELARYVEDELGPVLMHDAATSNKLFPTLQAYLECDGAKAAAAERLHVQRRTLYYRLERLNSLLGRSLEVPDVRQRLLLAVRGLELLNQPAGKAMRRGLPSGRLIVHAQTAQDHVLTLPILPMDR